MEEIHIDLLTVIIAAIIYVIIGGIWYSPMLFEGLLRKLHKEGKKAKMKMWPGIFFEFISAFVISFFLALILGFLGATSTLDGIYAAIGIWFGFVLTTHLSGVIWGKTPFKAFLIHAGFWLVGFGVMGGILGA